MKEILPIGLMLVIEEKKTDDGNGFCIEGKYKIGIVRAVSDDIHSQVGINDGDEIIYVSGKGTPIGLGFEPFQALNIEDVIGIVYVEKNKN